MSLAKKHNLSNIMALEKIMIETMQKNVDSVSKVLPRKKEWNTFKICGVKLPLASILDVVKLFAGAPLRTTPSGCKFSVLSWEFFGCVLIYVVIIPIYWAVFTDVYPLFEKPSDDPTEHFNQQIYYELFATLMIPYLITPFTTWLDAPRTADYINRCTQFLDTYENTARKRLHFSLKTKYLLVFATVGIVCQNIAVQIVPPYLSFWKTPACTINLVALCSSLSYWMCLTDCLSQAGEAIARELKLELHSKRCDAKKIVRYKQLWLELSKMTTDASSHFYRTATVPVLLTFFLITISVYGFFASLRSPVYFAFYSFCVFFNAMPLFLICNNAYVTVAKVRDPTLKLLVTVRRSRVNASCWHAVSSFLETIDESPPVISLGGYAVLDRQFLHAAGTTISTYLVVIFQFRMSLQASEKKPSSMDLSVPTISPSTESA